MPTIAQIFARTLRKAGVQYVFGVPSGNMIDYIEALRAEEGIEFILVGHEATASIMADVCGRLTGIPGVCFGTFGPGATNLSTGVGGALLDRSPLIAFTDEMPDRLLNRTVQMNIDHQQLFKPLTKWTTRASITTFEDSILEGIQIATSGVSGPVHIGIPSGIGLEKTSKRKIPDNIELNNNDNSFKIEKDTLVEIERVYRTSKKPILAIGLSAVRAGVKQQVIQIVEKFQLPVVLTPMAKGMFPENHPLYVGVLFHALSDIVAETYSETDLIIGIGYDPIEFNYEDWMPDVTLIHFNKTKADIDSNKNIQVYNVLGKLQESLSEFLKFESIPNSWKPEIIEKRKDKISKKLTPKKGSFGPLAVVNELRNILPSDGMLTVDVGAHLHLIGQMWQTPEPEKLLMTNGWSSMGFAIPAALAAKLCHQDLKVAALMGDGGFLMMVGELATAKRLNLNIVFVVINDNSLSLIRIKQKKKKLNHQYGTTLGNIANEPTNHYFGVTVIRACNFFEYQKALKTAFNSGGPAVIEAVVDGSEYENLVLKPNKKFK